MAYATYSDVQARVPGFTFSASTKPSTTQITQWLVEADAMLNGALLAAGLTSPNADARGLEILKAWATDYGEGHARMALAAAGNDSSNDSGKDILERFLKLVSADPADDGIMFNAALYGAMLEGGDAPEGARRVRGYVLDNDDELTVEDGDFDPAVTKSALEDQW